MLSWVFICYKTNIHCYLVDQLFDDANEDERAHEHRHIRKVGDKILSAVIFCRHMNLKDGNVNVAQVIIHPLGWVADEKSAVWVVVFQLVFEGSAYEAAADNSNVYHFSFCLFLL